jgi:TonB-dependent SusC/RagA subfamily outer membrane receptor
VIRRPGGQISVRIRGPNSLNAGQEPLFVVDGMVAPPGTTGLGDLDPSSVESITVLKDAGSTAIYGSRGANGVILIKTKRGGGG